MKDNIQIKFGILKIVLDFCAVFLAWVTWYYLRIQWDFIPFVYADNWIHYPNINDIIWFFSLSAITFIILIAFDWHYRFNLKYSKTWELFRLIFINIVWCLLIIAYYALFKHQLFFSRILLFQVFCISTIYILIFRFILWQFRIYLFKNWILNRNILIIWWWKVLDILRNKLLNSFQYKIVRTDEQFQENKNLKGLDEIWYIFNNEEEKNKILNYCQINQIWFSFIPDTQWVLLSRLHVSMIWWFPLLTIIPTSIYWWRKFLKRILDILISSILIIILCPLLLIICLIIKIDSAGPIVYKSLRVWRNWELFNMLKFRSMIINADNIKDKLIDKNHRNWPLFKIKNDPRVTRFGRFIRRFSIDELPQLFNVLIWNMSLVWPRAHLRNEVLQYDELQKRVLTVKPWITGLSQINWRSDLEFEEEIKLDLQYIVYWSLILDLQIIIQTPFILLKGEGAD